MASTAREFDHLKIPLEKILEATNNFDDKNIIGAGGFGKVYKGKLLHSRELINISARRLDRKHGQGDVEFWTEVSVLSVLSVFKVTTDIHARGIVKMIGFCDEDDEKIIITPYDIKGSLSMYLGDPTTFSWGQRIYACYFIATAISWIHGETDQRDFSFIHRNINSSTILLDDDWSTKLSGFEFSIKHSFGRKNLGIHSEVIGTQGYIDPTYLMTGSVTHKSDVYSFGVVLFEMLCGRHAYIPTEQDDKKFLATLAKYHHEKGTLQDIIHPEIWNQVARNSKDKILFGKISKIAYSCLNKEREQRPDIYQIVCELQKRILSSTDEADSQDVADVPSVEELGSVVESTMSDSEKAFSFDYEADGIASQDALDILSVEELGSDVESMVSNSEKVKNIEHLRIRLKDIKLATSNFSTNHGSDMYSYINYYKAKLKCFDREYLPFAITKNKSQPPKRLYTVWIAVFQRPRHASYDEDMFYRNVEIASSCKHENIKPLLGFCDEGSHRILVYRCNSNIERLPAFLESRNPTWEQRLKICLNIAQGLHYLHYEMEDQKIVIYNNLRTNNIVLDDNWGIVGFDFSMFLPPNQDEVVLDPRTFESRFEHYKDPEYLESWKMRRGSDVYSFGVVMSEILVGFPVCDAPSYMAHFMLKVMVHRWSDNRKIKKMICPKLREENGENNSFLPKGPNEDSLDTYLEIMYECLAPTHDQRPTMKVVITKLEKAISLQENHKDNFRMSYEDIKSATQNFNPQNYVGGGGFGGVYKGDIARGNGHQTIVAKRLDTRLGQGEKQYYNELQILCEYKHANVIGLVGYSNETRERIIVYEHASRGSLDRYLNDARLTWKKRLNICIDVASGLAFLHGDAETGQDVVIHRDIKTPNILLFDDWKAKLGDFGLSLITTLYEGKNYIIDYACGTRGYVDPVYEKTRFLTIESDIYSFGVVLFEILCGRSTYPINKKEVQFVDLVKHKFKEGKKDEMVFEAIKKEIMPKSLTTFQTIAYRCLDDDRKKRPTAKEVLEGLKMALEYQEGKRPVGTTSWMENSYSVEELSAELGHFVMGQAGKQDQKLRKKEKMKKNNAKKGGAKVIKRS